MNNNTDMNINKNNSPGHGPIGVLDLRQFPWSFCCCFQTAQSGRPRALGGQSRFVNPPLSIIDDGGALFDCIFTMDPNDEIHDSGFLEFIINIELFIPISMVPLCSFPFCPIVVAGFLVTATSAANGSNPIR